jgi:hypothetical protein
MQCHLSGNLGHRLHQETRGSYPHLDRAEGMRNRFTAHAHPDLVEPSIATIQPMIVDLVVMLLA